MQREQRESFNISKEMTWHVFIGGKKKSIQTIKPILFKNYTDLNAFLSPAQSMLLGLQWGMDQQGIWVSSSDLSSP